MTLAHAPSIVVNGGSIVSGTTGGSLTLGGTQINPSSFTPTGGNLTLNGNTITGGTLTGTLPSGVTLTLNTSALNGASLSGFTVIGDTLTLTNGTINLGSNFGTVTAITGSFITSQPGVFTFSTP